MIESLGLPPTEAARHGRSSQLIFRAIPQNCVAGENLLCKMANTDTHSLASWYDHESSQDPCAILAIPVLGYRFPVPASERLHTKIASDSLKGDLSAIVGRHASMDPAISSSSAACMVEGRLRDSQTHFLFCLWRVQKMRE